jgi:hypothetical protein
MSAFVVSHDHIDALLSFALSNRTYGPVSYYVTDTQRLVAITEENATEVGRILLTENERSVRSRYPAAACGDEAMPGTVGQDAESYKFRPWPRPVDPVAALKGCSCFDYQACETDDYESSLAWTIVNAIRDRAISRLPGYDNAQGWEFNRAKEKSK